MSYSYLLHTCYFFFIVTLLSCKNSASVFVKPQIEYITTKKMQVRALTFARDTLYFGADNNTYGWYSIKDQKIAIKKQLYKTENLEFRSIAKTKNALFLLNAGSPAFLFKITKDTTAVVYQENHKNTFYNTMVFLADKKTAIAVADPVEKNCISILKSTDSGTTWKKIPCAILPKTALKEAGFAASNSCIATYKNKVWIATGGAKSNVLFSKDYGESWQKYATPIIQGKTTQGIYSIAAYDSNTLFSVGGDYTRPKENKNTKIQSKTAGKSWSVMADGQAPGFQSCVQYVTQGKGKKIVSVGYNGMHLSIDGGTTFTKISDIALYTLIFVNKNTAYGAGPNKIVKITFAF